MRAEFTLFHHVSGLIMGLRQPGRCQKHEGWIEKCHNR